MGVNNDSMGIIYGCNGVCGDLAGFYYDLTVFHSGYEVVFYKYCNGLQWLWIGMWWD